MENNSDYQRCEMEYPFSFFLLSLRRAVIVRLFYRGSILNYGLRVSRKTTVCQQRFRSGRAGGVDAALSFVPRVISMERGGCEKKLQQTVLPAKQPHHKGGATYIEDT